MKSLKYISLFVMLFLTASFLINVQASTNNSATWTINESTTQNVYGVNHVLAYGTTTTPSEEIEGSQKVNVFKMKTDGISSKLVSWAVQSGKGRYTRMGLSKIAKNYEETHPGWIVIAGINGDQYFPTFGSQLGTDGSFFFENQPYYPLIMDNEVRFGITPTGVSSSNYVGITNDSKVDSLLPAAQLAGLRVEVIDENGEVIYMHDVDKVNESPETTETTIWFAYNSEERSGEYVTQEVKTTNNLYVVENAELAYMSNSKEYSVGSKDDAVFGRGTISTVTNDYVIDRWQFAVETSNSDLMNYLGENVRIRVQYYYDDDRMNNVESAFGFHSIQRTNGQDIVGIGTYDTRRYNRSIFGKTEDGTYVLMTVAKANYSGTTHDESNAILKHYGVTEAYQQDGGGSVTAIIRNKYGDFDIVNESSDSGVKERSILNGCFFVVRDHECISYQKDSTRNSVTLTKKSNYNDQYISNIVAHLNGKSYPLQENGITIDGLEEATTYEITLTYDILEGNQKISVSNLIYATTNGYNIPESGVKIKNTNGTNVVLEHTNNQNIDYQEVKLLINNQEYDILKEKEIKIEQLTKNN